jgi:hypothetical protein
MQLTWQAGVTALLETINQILTAGIAITAFALLLYALTFNLRDRVARSFALILICVVVVFSAEALGSSALVGWEIDFWLRVQWVGIVLLPATYLHFSDALLTTTGKTNLWQKRLLIPAGYVIAFGFLATIPYSLVGDLVLDQPPAPHLEPTWLTDVFIIFYLAVMVWSWVNFVNAYRRTLTVTSQRRMSYLIAGAIAPAVGSFPFLLFGSDFASAYPLLFWVVAVLANVAVSILLVVMAYAVAFFGVGWSDRIVRSRLLKWLMRGPFTASLALGLSTIVRRAGETFGVSYSPFVPISMVVTVLVTEYAITLLAPFVERWMFGGSDRHEIAKLQKIEDRLQTRNDLRQFLEMLLAAICDRLRLNGASILAVEVDGLNQVVQVGKIDASKDLITEVYQKLTDSDDRKVSSRQGNLIIVPLWDGVDFGEPEMVGVLFLEGLPVDQETLSENQYNSIDLLLHRAALALRDRRTQEQVFQSLETLSPQVELIQQLRATGRYDPTRMIASTTLVDMEQVTQWVRDALTHYWGGPRLTDSPLLQLKVIQDNPAAQEGNAANALRMVLKETIEMLKPDGERKYTSEWLLYNILVMKFVEGKKVREIANRLAVSEADLYRKQRIAIEAVARRLLEQEDSAWHPTSPEVRTAGD